MHDARTPRIVEAVLAALAGAGRLREVADRLGLLDPASTVQDIRRRLEHALACSADAVREAIQTLGPQELEVAGRTLGLEPPAPFEALRDQLLRAVSESSDSRETDDEDLDEETSSGGDDEPPTLLSAFAGLLSTLPVPRLRSLAASLGVSAEGDRTALPARVALGVVFAADFEASAIDRFLVRLEPQELRAFALRVGIPSRGDARDLTLRLSAWLDLFRPEPPRERRVTARGLLLGRWRLGPVRGASSAGTLHEAVDTRLPERSPSLAIVAHLPSDRALKAEVALGLDLTLSGAVRYLDHGIDEDGRDVALVADPGLPLASWLAEHGPVSVEQAARFTLGLSATLDGAHHEGVLHGDLHVDAVWIEAERLRLGGFGLRRGRDGAADARDRPRPPRPVWAAPEVTRAGIVVPASDQYALALLFLALVGGHPGVAPADAVGLPPTQADAVRRALAEQARDRFRCCLDFGLALVAR